EGRVGCNVRRHRPHAPTFPYNPPRAPLGIPASHHPTPPVSTLFGHETGFNALSAASVSQSATRARTMAWRVAGSPYSFGVDLTDGVVRLRPLRRRDAVAWDRLRRQNERWLSRWEAT